MGVHSFWTSTRRRPHDLAASSTTVLGGPTDRSSPTFHRLPVLGRVVKETLRLYPPAWVFDRSPLHDLDLGGHRPSRRVPTCCSSPWASAPRSGRVGRAGRVPARPVPGRTCRPGTRTSPSATGPAAVHRQPLRRDRDRARSRDDPAAGRAVPDRSRPGTCRRVTPRCVPRAVCGCGSRRQTGL